MAKGRPKKKAKDLKTEQVRIKLTKSTKAAFERVAAAENRSTADWLRVVGMKAVAAHDKESEK